MAQMGFFDLSDRYASLDAKGDPLVEIDAIVPWEEFRPVLERVWRKPEAVRRIGRVIAMGCAVDEPGNRGSRAEFTLAFDPEAAEIVLRGALPLTLIPLDATRQFRADRGFVERLGRIRTASAGAMRALLGACFAAAEAGESRPLHGPCVPLLAVRPDLFGCRRMRLAVDRSDGPDAGALVRGEWPVEIALTVDAAGVRDALARASGEAGR